MFNAGVYSLERQRTKTVAPVRNTCGIPRNIIYLKAQLRYSHIFVFIFPENFCDSLFHLSNKKSNHKNVTRRKGFQRLEDWRGHTVQITMFMGNIL